MAEEQMMVIDAQNTRSALPFPELIEVLRQAFASGAVVPLRHHHGIPQQDGTEATVLIMPAWYDAAFIGVKIVNVFPGNGARGLPGLHSTYFLSDGATGRPLALIDGNEITGRRTAAVAALGASFLSRPESERLLVVGSGRVASLLPAAFSAVRQIRAVEIWSPRREAADRLVDQLTSQGYRAARADDLEESSARADIISCATLAETPLIKGAWLQPGTHLDLIGSFTPSMREVDDQAIAAGSLFVDTIDALKESGDLVQPLASGAITVQSIDGSLADLCEGNVAGRRSSSQITIFKAVGTALSDIAAGSLAYRVANKCKKDGI